MAGRLCRRYGPGRIPYASRRDVGGGVAMAATGLLAAVLWFGGATLLYAFGLGGDSLGFFIVVGLAFVPFAGPAAFVAGTLLWRSLYSAANPQFSGAVCGGMTGLASLSAGALGFSTVFAVASVADGNVAPAEGVGFWVLLLVMGFVFAVALAGWVVVPVCAVGGWYHERTKPGSG